MKKFTLLTFLCVLLCVPITYGQTNLQNANVSASDISNSSIDNVTRGGVVNGTRMAEITQTGATLNACVDFQDGDVYTDSGGSAGNYSNNEFSTMTFCAPAGETISLNFTTFDALILISAPV